MIQEETAEFAGDVFEGDEWTAEGGLGADCFADGGEAEANWVDDSYSEGFRRKKLSFIYVFLCYKFSIVCRDVWYSNEKDISNLTLLHRFIFLLYKIIVHSCFLLPSTSSLIALLV